MPALIPEPHKLPGVCYAFTPDGLELPVVDVTLPLFRSELSDAELMERAEAFVRSMQAPGFFKGLFYKFVMPSLLKRSVMGRGLAKAWGGYLDAMTTYLFKLPPEAQGAWATPMDRKIAQGLRLSAQTISLRLQDMAELMAQALDARLRAQPGAPLHFVNIAGGPAVDSLNALIVLRKKDAALLAGRALRIHNLDLEAEAPAFGLAVLASLKAEGGPLCGLDLTLTNIPYDWSQTGALQACLQALPPDAIVVASSEGGLFDYGTDAAVEANLKVIRAHSPRPPLLAASLSRPDGVANVPTNRMAALKLRTVEDLARLTAPLGWTVTAKQGRPMGWVVVAE